MATSILEAEFNYSADHVWQIIRDPLSVARWAPGVKSVDLVGDGVRACSLKGGGSITESFVVHDNTQVFVYEVLSGIPVSSHRAWIEVIELTKERCRVVYGTEVIPDELGPVLERSSARALKKLDKFLGHNHV